METVEKQNVYKVAIYCRLSEEDRFKANANDDSNSIANQKTLLSQYCAERNWVIYDIYSDDDFTGSDRRRPEFNRLLNDAENKKFDAILCKTQSRFTREIEIVEKYINYLFPVWGIRFISVVDNADTEIKGNKKSRQINGLINEWYLEDMSENIKAVLTNRRQNGYFIGAFAPYGYKKDPNEKGHLIIDEEAAEVVRKIYSLYLTGIGRTAIARELNRLKIPTPTDYKLAHGERYKNNYTATHDHLWRYFMIGHILTCETYIGNLVQNKAHSISYKTKIIKPTDKSDWIRVEDTHEAIIDKDVWDLAQRILAAKPKPTFNNCSVNVLSKKVVCSECGRFARILKSGGKNLERKYLRCSTRHYAPEECVGININYNTLVDLVYKEFRNITEKMLDETKVDSMIVLSDKVKDTINYYTLEYEKIAKKISDNDKCLKNLYLDKLNGVISEAVFMDFQKSFTEEKETNTEVLNEIKTKILSLQDESKNINTKSEMIKKYAQCETLTYEMAQLFINKIVVHPKPPYSRENNVEIFWNF